MEEFKLNNEGRFIEEEEFEEEEEGLEEVEEVEEPFGKKKRLIESLTYKHILWILLTSSIRFYPNFHVTHFY